MSIASGSGVSHGNYCASSSVSSRPSSLAAGRAVTAAWMAALGQGVPPVRSAATSSALRPKAVRAASSSGGSRAQGAGYGNNAALLASAAACDNDYDPDDPPLAGIMRQEPRKRCTRQYENTPMQQSIVDQVVFGRDMDFSGETQFDEEFIRLFQGSAGRGTWELRAPHGSLPPPGGKDQAAAKSGSSSARVHSEGRRVFPFSPTLHSTVDQVVFGTGDGGFVHVGKEEDNTGPQFDGSAGRPSSLPRAQGVRTYGAGGPLADVPHSGNTIFTRKSARGTRGRAGRAAW
mmetsp:Transcript_1326/g.3805  ORF Transcript_1326/g.3805 Transcript_1326/m.3805 type:complete len:289 (+) Transcript_1326:94-960(+)